jgi:hypothetical protein
MSSVEFRTVTYLLYMPKIKTEIKVVTGSGNTGSNFADSWENRDRWVFPWRLYGVRCLVLLLQETVQKFLLDTCLHRGTELIVLCLRYQLLSGQQHKSWQIKIKVIILRLWLHKLEQRVVPVRLLPPDFEYTNAGFWQFQAKHRGTGIFQVCLSISLQEHAIIISPRLKKHIFHDDSWIRRNHNADCAVILDTETFGSILMQICVKRKGKNYF